MGSSVWFWNFGTGNPTDVSIIQSPEFTFSSSGEYQVWQYVENQWGCSDSTSMWITIRPIVTFYIPNAFSPNDDGQNDYFMPFGNNIDPDNFEMIIFDRWGSEIYRTSNMNTPWDGTSYNSDGKILPQGVYVYSIFVKLDGKDQFYRGIVTLVY